MFARSPLTRWLLPKGFPRMTHPDTIATTKDKLTWYHWNHINTTYYNDTMKGQGVDPACPGCTDMFTHRAFGAQVSATGLSGGGPSDTLGGLSRRPCLPDARQCSAFDR